MPDFELDRLSATPMWEQLYFQLREAIRSGAIPPDRKLPTEQQLADDTGAGRSTVTRAFGLLREDGWAVWVRGRGVFSAPADVVARLKREGRRK